MRSCSQPNPTLANIIIAINTYFKSQVQLHSESYTKLSPPSSLNEWARVLQLGLFVSLFVCACVLLEHYISNLEYIFTPCGVCHLRSPASSYHKIESHSHKILSRSHKLASHYHKIESCYHKIQSRSHKLASHYHKILRRSHK